MFNTYINKTEVYVIRASIILRHNHSGRFSYMYVQIYDYKIVIHLRGKNCLQRFLLLFLDDTAATYVKSLSLELFLTSF